MPLRSARITRLVPAVLAAGALAVLTASCASQSDMVAQASQQNQQQNSKFKGTELGIPVKIPAVTLTDTAGQAYDLKARGSGKITLLYYGYTNCPDVCPTTMADVASALRMLPADQRAKVSVVFVTTDPDRDTADRLKSWLGKFDPAFTGLTGTVTEVDAAAKSMGVPVDPPAKQADGTVAVDHGTQVTAFGPDGVAHVVWLTGVPPKDIAHDLTVLATGA